MGNMSNMSKPKFDPNAPFEVVDKESSSKPKFDPNAPFEILGIEEEKPSVSKFESAVRGGLQGMPFIGSYTDEVEGGLRAVAQGIPYKEGRQQARDAFKAADEANPVTYGGAQMVGSFVGDIPRFVGKIPHPVTAGLGAAYGALEGGIYGLGASEADLTQGDFSGAAKDASLGASIGAVAPTVLKGVGTGIKKAAEGSSTAAKYAAKKIGRVVADVPEEATDRYIKRRAQVNEARPTEDLMDTIDEKVGKYISDVEKKSEFLRQSREAAKEALEERKMYLKIAREEADFAFKAEREALSRARPPEEMGDSILDVIKSTRRELGEKSGKAFDILESQGVGFQPSSLQKAARNILEDLKIDGKLPPKGPSRDAYMKVDDYVKFLDGYGEDLVPASSLKKIIQNLDELSKDAYDPFKSDFVAKTLAGVRRKFDEALKGSSPEYKDAMKELAPQADFYNRLQEAFKNPDAARAALKNVSNPDSASGRRALTMIKEIDERTGTKLSDVISEYQKAQAVLRSPTKMSGLKQTNPAYNKVLEEDTALRTAQESGQNQISQAAQALEQSKEAAGQFNKIMPNSSESSVNRLKNVLDDKNIKLRRQVEALPDGENLLDEIRDRGALEAFNKDGTRGSRLTVAGTALGTMTGTMAAGFPGATVGAAVGGALGATADKYAGRAVRGALNQTMNLEDAVKRLAPKYQRAFESAGGRGSTAMAVTHYILQQQDPEYRQQMKDIGYQTIQPEDR